MSPSYVMLITLYILGVLLLLSWSYYVSVRTREGRSSENYSTLKRVISRDGHSKPDPEMRAVVRRVTYRRK